LVFGALATWRVTHLLAKEDGPANLVIRLRARLGDGFAGKLMDCFNCLSIWVAAFCSVGLSKIVGSNPGLAGSLRCGLPVRAGGAGAGHHSSNA
jgi:hypothetical protein